MFTLIATWMNNFFRRMQIAARPVWEFRIAYSRDKNGWIIELKESDLETWLPVCERSDNTRNEQLVRRFNSYNEARLFSVQQGFHLVYEQAYFTRKHAPLHPAATAIEQNVALTTSGLELHPTPCPVPAPVAAHSVVRPLSHSHGAHR